LATLVKSLSQAQLTEALDAARQISDEYDRAQVLAALAARLSGAQLAEALSAARQISDEYDRA
jgi:1,2-phenylacetyl-CoA epoxidase catalytic subunit